MVSFCMCFGKVDEVTRVIPVVFNLTSIRPLLWFVVFSVTALLSCSFGGSGGGANHHVPDSVRSGDPIVITIDLMGWGTRGSVTKRFTDISLYYRLVGESQFKQGPLSSVSEPKPLANLTNGQLVACEFRIPPYPAGTKGQLEYYVDLKLDGHLNHQNGIKTIAVE